MYWLEIQDVLFLLKHIKLPADNFNIFDHVSLFFLLTFLL